MPKLTTNKIIYGGGLVVILSWLAYAAFYQGASSEAAGQFGDKFGALNTLFTGLASVAVVAALWHERENVEAAKKDREEELRAMKADALDRATQHAELIRQMGVQARASQQAAEIQAIIWQLDYIHRNWQSYGASQAEMAEKRHTLLGMLERATGIGVH